MTRLRYLTWRFGQAFGISFTGRHASRAAGEQHLLREAEEVLGRLTWTEIEDVEELSVEYWNLRKLSNEYNELASWISEANSTLQQSHDQRASLLDMVTDSTKDLVTEREQCIEETERLGAERDSVLEEARSVKRRHDGIKAKLEVLAAEEQQNPSVIEESKNELRQLKKYFLELRDRRDSLAKKIDSLDTEIEQLGVKIETRRNEMRDEAFGSYQNIGKANRDLSQSRAKLGVLENKMVALFAEIGRYISTYSKHPSVHSIAHTHRRLIAQMHALRMSIHLNNLLSGRATEKPVQWSPSDPENH